MTQPTPPTRSPADRSFARDVARQLDRRRTRRRLTLWSALLALVAAGAMYLRCGGAGFGLGGLGPGEGGEGARTPAGPRRCAIRVSSRGIAVNGRAMSRAEAVAACKAASGAEAVITGDAREGDWVELRNALTAAGVRDIVVHEPAPPAGGAAPGPPGR